MDRCIGMFIMTFNANVFIGLRIIMVGLFMSGLWSHEY